ncbi:MAG: COR domain-containing protein [Paraglaciecola sp.]|uniref:leucine-rich repeat domain-containing protein n=1 Tax=Paraglaciecola sp. TaxID=1920173 RepID=UPI003298DCA9
MSQKSISKNKSDQTPDFKYQLEQAIANKEDDVTLNLKGLARIPDSIHLLPFAKSLHFYNCNALSNITEFDNAELPLLESLSILDSNFYNEGTLIDTSNLDCLMIQLQNFLPNPQPCIDLSPLANLKNLKKLVIKTNINFNFSSLSKLVGLLSLEVINARSIDFSNIQFLSALRELTICCSTSLSNLDFLTVLIDLEVFRSAWCYQLNDISALSQLSQLKEITIIQCALKELKVSKSNTNLEKIELVGNAYLHEIHGLNGLQRLKTAFIDSCDSITCFPAINDLPSLKSLTITSCKMLESVGNIFGAFFLQDLDLSNNILLKHFPNVDNSKKLKNIRLSGNKKLKSLPKFACFQFIELIDLDQCESIESLPSIKNLRNLKYLKISFAKISSIDSFEGLSSIRVLILNHLYRLIKIPTLESIQTLEVIDLNLCTFLTQVTLPLKADKLKILILSSCERIIKISCLSKYKALEIIDLTYCHKLEEIPSLVDMKKLKELIIKKCDDVNRIGKMENLPELLELRIQDSYKLASTPDLVNLPALTDIIVTGAPIMREIGALKRLPSLRSLSLPSSEELTDLSPLSELKSLTTLSLNYCRNLSDISPISKLTSLKKLIMHNCEKVKDLSPLSALIKLQELDVRFTTALDVNPGANPFSCLTSLNCLFADKLLGAPQELGSAKEKDILPAIQAWGKDLNLAEVSESVIKVFILGNGTVGKTQLARRLQGMNYDESVESTHGIELGEFQLSAQEDEYVGINAKIWDFGGQDIYLSTHSIFLDERAIFIIAWNPKYENTDVYEENNVPMRNRPLQYWLEYVTSYAGNQAPIIIVQTQCDKQIDTLKPPILGRKSNINTAVASSSKRSSGLDSLKVALKNVATLQLEKFGKVRMPINWLKLSECLRDLRKDKIITQIKFDSLCQKLSIADPSYAKEYLHNSGEIFWVNSLFGGKIVLDMSWMLEGVYTLFRRNGVLPIITSQGGHFSESLLETIVWKGRSPAERGLFIEIMKSCEAIIEISPSNYIAPSLLPSEKESHCEINTIWQSRASDNKICLKYSFLHEGILRRILIEICQEAGYRAVYWAYGICFFDIGHNTVVKISSRLPNIENNSFSGEIYIEGMPSSPTEDRSIEIARSFIEKLSDAIRRIKIGEQPSVKILYSENRNYFKNTENESLKNIPNSGVSVRKREDLIPVYISYAWSEKSIEMVNALEEALPDYIELRRDTKILKSGESIVEFMKQLGRGAYIFVVLSDDYLHRVNCMFEMLCMFRFSQDDKNHMLSRVIPLFVEETNSYSRAKERDNVVQFWQKEYNQLYSMLDKRGFFSISQADRNELIMIQDFLHYVSDITSWFSDVLMPRGTAGIDEAVELLCERIAEERSKLRTLR